MLACNCGNCKKCKRRRYMAEWRRGNPFYNEKILERERLKRTNKKMEKIIEKIRTGKVELPSQFVRRKRG